MDEFDIIRELREGGNCVYACKAEVLSRWTCPPLPCKTVFSCLSQEGALNVKVKHGAQLHAQHTRDVRGGPRSVFSLALFVQVFFRLIHLMGRGVDWSLADVQFVRDGMAGGANLCLIDGNLNEK